MGLGGYLFWTAVAREIKNHTGIPCLPIESYNNGIIKIVKSDIFKNNPNIVQEVKDSVITFPIILNNPATNYCKKDTQEKAVQRHDKHVISQICEVYGINDPNLKCDIFFTEEEKAFGKDFADKVGDNYITIEPNTKDTYTVNKRYPHKKWQHIVDDISSKVKVVQIGEKTDKVLDGVIDMTGKTCFRKATSIISNSLFHVGSEGGLMHAANAVNKTSVIVITGFLHPRMTCYDENTNIWIGSKHGPCGMKVLCKICEKEANDHDYKEIIKAINKKLEENEKYSHGS